METLWVISTVDGTWAFVVAGYPNLITHWLLTVLLELYGNSYSSLLARTQRQTTRHEEQSFAFIDVAVGRPFLYVPRALNSSVEPA